MTLVRNEPGVCISESTAGPKKGRPASSQVEPAEEADVERAGHGGHPPDLRDPPAAHRGAFPHEGFRAVKHHGKVSIGAESELGEAGAWFGSQRDLDAQPRIEGNP